MKFVFVKFQKEVGIRYLFHQHRALCLLFSCSCTKYTVACLSRFPGAISLTCFLSGPSLALIPFVISQSSSDSFQLFYPRVGPWDVSFRGYRAQTVATTCILQTHLAWVSCINSLLYQAKPLLVSTALLIQPTELSSENLLTFLGCQESDTPSLP